jgi:hypothetical protein
MLEQCYLENTKMQSRMKQISAELYHQASALRELNHHYHTRTKTTKY